MANDALRVIAVAYRDLGPQDEDPETEADDNGVFPFETAGLTLLALLGITDVLRKGVLESVQSCQKAGIKVRMITGDNKTTATAIARSCGILGPSESAVGRVMEGKEFMELVEGVVCAYCRTARCGCSQKAETASVATDGKPDPGHFEVERAHDPPEAQKLLAPMIRSTKKKPSALKSAEASPGRPTKADTKVQFKEETEIFEASADRRRDCAAPSKADLSRRVRVDTIKNGREFDRLIGSLCVLARSRPQDKYAVVVGLKERGHVVAVTGDGTNDAPALSKADVGFAMGIAGTDLAKSSADIIITDDNFSSIVSAVVRGRNVYDSIRKFLTFQLTVNVVAVVGTFFGGLFLNHAIISAVQMLWINLIMDTLASLALATEPPIAQDLLKRPPHAKNSSIVSKKMLKHILGQAAYQLCALLLVLFEGPRLFRQVRLTLFDKGSLH